jgi:sugar lactone lactonase YvrE
MIAVDSLTPLGRDLERPECVLCTARGDTYVADWRGGVTLIAADGSQTLFAGPAPGNRRLKPNGIALRADGSFLVADLSPGTGGIFELCRDGQVRPLLEQVDGITLPPTNFVVEDSAGRTWITVSTRRVPRILGCRPDCDDGFIVMMDERGARVVADGLGYANEVAIDPSGRWLYVNETFARRLSRFALRSGGELGPRETVTAFGHGTFPDGVAFDAEGHAWITSIVSNRVIRVAPDGAQRIVLEDADDDHLGWVEAAWAGKSLERRHLDCVRSRRLRNISSLAFCGADLKTAVLGCLQGTTLETFDAGVVGLPPVHWNY